MADNILIVGGGLAAVRTAQALRDLDFDGPIVLLSEERELPYDRPPLSKNFLLGRSGESEIQLLSPERLAELGIEVRLGQRVVGLDPAAHRVQLDDGQAVEYHKLVVATGARPIRLTPLDPHPAVHYLRDADDARGLRDALVGQPRVGIVGGGFIGLEIAGVARTLGCEVTVIEAADTPLAPVLGTELGGVIQRWHETNGVAFRCGAPLVGVGHDDGTDTLLLATGEPVPADIVVAGVGVRPEIAWLASSGLELHRGLVIDERGRTSDPDVVGVGDVTCRHRGDDCDVTGHWTATSDQARTAAETLLGREPAGRPGQAGYFWSDQYGVRLQFSGAVAPDAAITVVAGAIADDKFVALCGPADAPTGVFSMNSPRDFVRQSLAIRNRGSAARA